MIDIGLTKLAMIGVVALVVIGPEKLPTVARMAGSLFGRAQRYLNDLKAEVSREIELDELRKMQQDVHQAAKGFEQSISKEIADTEHSIRAGLDDGNAGSGSTDASVGAPVRDRTALKAKDFRRKKLARTSAIPSWYRQQTGRKARVLSGAARVARYRPKGQTRNPSFH
ncbi:MAG: Sec-independent protein translocase protein TatB [Burkholderiaceae bacterium]